MQPPSISNAPVEHTRSPPVRALESPALFPVAAGIASVLALGFAWKVRSPLGLLVGAYLLALFLVLRLAALLVLRRFIPGARDVSLDLPLAGGRVLRGRAAWIAPIAALALLTAMREGALGPDLAFDVTWNRVETRNTWNSNTRYSWSAVGTGRTWLRGLAVHCSRPRASGRGSDVTTGFNSYMRCAEGFGGAGTVHVAFTLEVSDAACHLPLYNSASVPYSLSMNVAANWRDGSTFGSGSGSGNVALTGHVTQTSTGLGSCRAFNYAVGRQIARDAVAQLNAFLAVN